MGIVVGGTNALCSSFIAPEAAECYEVKLGYFPDLTHGTAILGIGQGLFTDALDEDGAS